MNVDNCSENKNKEMFAFLTLLVDYGFFEEIYYNFAMPGESPAEIKHPSNF